MPWLTPHTDLAAKRSKDLRRRQTHCEKIFWEHVRAKRFHGFKFRRQVPIGPFIVDFLCIKAMLIIEIDGDSHNLPEAQEYDRRREAYLQELNFSILRFSNLDILYSLEECLRKLFDILQSSGK